MPVSGVVLFARTSKAAGRLCKQFRDNTVKKIYWAVVEGMIEPPSGMLQDWLQRDATVAGKFVVVAAGTAGAREARLEYETRGQANGLSWIEIRPSTGRRHQLRVQFAQRRHPIFGDRKYGSAFNLGTAIALHARALTFQHPTREESITLEADVPANWREVFAALLPQDFTRDKGVRRKTRKKP